MNTFKKYDIIGIGIGPFNLGLAALSAPVKELSTLFLDRAAAFDWHPGLMLDSATLQVPFMADLVTMADPASRYSFLNFLKETGRLYKFYIRENFYILRKEYNAYCKWVAANLPNCLFSHSVELVEYDEAAQHYVVRVQNRLTGTEETYYANKLVLGTGTSPRLPELGIPVPAERIIHGGSYLEHREAIGHSGSVALVGSGQSAAEIFQDLLPDTTQGLKLSWFSRPDRFFPMEYSKLTLELTSPEYVDFFYNMAAEKRKSILAKQPPLYKGISYDLINEIFDTLYEMSVDNQPLNVELRPACQLDRIALAENGKHLLHFTQVQQEASFTHEADFVILATGYTYKTPAFLKGIEHRIARTADGLFDVTRHYSIGKTDHEIYVQNAELHTHGFVTPDLGMGAYRNACILNAITGRTVYQVESRIAFQQFGV